MKKAKLVLTAIGVLAVVSGALAFTVRENDEVYCYDPTLPPTSNHCEIIPLATLEPNDVLLFDDRRCTDDPAILTSDCNTLPQTPVEVYEGD
jgi:hypothetical protein